MTYKAAPIIFLPAFACANDGEILGFLWLEVALFAAVLVFIFFTKLSTRNRFFVFAAYLASVVFAHGVTWNFPYTENRILIAVTSILFPALVTWLAWRQRIRRAKN